ncbi:shieldin complex subunit 1 isoform X2 [Heteronotia binoei]|uniref:shieldin complex subunit 1 isoform X2 n=1 Tax=Heteronotia binoei TaxID=13085 RepID=UPI002930849B|nr:shieldin complex subunit 1 isoform X2 [Heteronotia binoei]
MEGSHQPEVTSQKSYQTEESSLLDISCTITEKSFLVHPSTERNSDCSCSVNAFVSPASTMVDTDPDSTIFEEHPTGASRNLFPKSCEKTKSNNCMNSESFQANEHLSSRTPEQKDGEPTIKKSLDIFYSTCCPKKQFGGSPEIESASQCVSAKIADLVNREGTEYALQSLRVAQMVLNRDGNKVFPQHSSGTCFSAAMESNANVEKGEKLPGLSDDVLQFLLKQNVTK